MRSDDETPEVPDNGEEHEQGRPAPETWAGRRRAEEEGDADEMSSGFTEEFDAIERELDAELEQSEEAAGEDESDDQTEAELEQLDEEAFEALEEDELAEQEEAELDEAALGGAEDEEVGVDEVDGEEVGATVEADTLAVADREQAEEAALAGLRARTAEHEAKLDTPPAEGEREPDAEAEGVAAVEAEAEEEEDDDGKTPRAKPVWARFLAASVLIVVSIAAATSISLLLYLTDIARGLGDNDALASLRDQLDEVDGGAPQTILILGSDKRLGMEGDPGRSDTTILLRVDPEKDAIALLSIPRDLKVTIPKVGVDKFNAAYAAGGPELTLEVVERLTGLDVNHVVNINFTGFADAVNAIGCVYIDVDRNYFIPPEAEYAEIDIDAGYQRLCGFKALQYVRFRYDDNDLVRAARQQDFLREARQKLPPGTLINKRGELLDIFTEYTTSDISEGVSLLELLKTFAAVQTAPVREVHFPAELGDATSGFVTAGEEAIKSAVAQFLGVEGTPGARPAGEADNPQEESEPRREKPGKDKPGDGSEQDFVGPAMTDSTGAAQASAKQIAAAKTKGGDPMVRFPIYYPTRIAPGSALNDASRAFVIDGPDKEKYYGYKMVAGLSNPGGFTEYYGVSGTSWVDAPILANESEIRVIDGKAYLLFYDGDRLRLVGWKTAKAAYWVNNSLLQSLEEGEMLSIATSMRELGK